MARRRRGGLPRQSDPGHRDRIIDAGLDVIAEVGASHRVIAAAAGVPLGSMTYHFDGMRELLREAFGRFAAAVAERFEQRMAEAKDVEEAKRAMVDIITVDPLGNQRDLVLAHELYTLAARDASCRDITNTWMAASRRALERHFDPLTARLLDALIEGLSMHRALDTEPHDRFGSLADARVFCQGTVIPVSKSHFRADAEGSGNRHGEATTRWGHPQ